MSNSTTYECESCKAEITREDFCGHCEAHKELQLPKRYIQNHSFDDVDGIFKSHLKRFRIKAASCSSFIHGEADTQKVWLEIDAENEHEAQSKAEVDVRWKTGAKLVKILKCEEITDLEDLKVLFVHTKEAYGKTTFNEWMKETKEAYDSFAKGKENVKTFSQWINGQILALT